MCHWHKPSPPAHGAGELLLRPWLQPLIQISSRQAPLACELPPTPPVLPAEAKQGPDPQCKEREMVSQKQLRLGFGLKFVAIF